MLAVLVTGTSVMQNSLHPLSTFSIIACHLLDFIVQGKITEADTLTVRQDATHMDYHCPHVHHPPIFFTQNALSGTTLPIFPGFEHAPNNAGLHTQWLG